VIKLPDVELDGALWRKASASNYTGNCVEIAVIGDQVAVRDTKDAGAGPVLLFTGAEWDSFLDGVKNGEFDR
jgi:uncharacterized protein DUF397